MVPRLAWRPWPLLNAPPPETGDVGLTGEADDGLAGDGEEGIAPLDMAAARLAATPLAVIGVGASCPSAGVEGKEPEAMMALPSSDSAS